MKNKCTKRGQTLTSKGFTLIELLAVIVILAIIALIAVPIILNIVNDSKEESNKRSLEMYAKAVENAITKQQLDGSKPLTGTFTTENGKELLQDGEVKLIVEYDGPKLTIDRIDIYEDGNIYLEGIKSGEKLLFKKYGIKQSYIDGEIVYIDITTGKSCTNYHEDNSKTGYNGYTNKDSSNNETPKSETQTSCLKFYAFLDDGSDKINLLLDHNTTGMIAWGSSRKEGPMIAKKQLYEDTKGWNGTITPSDYKYNHSNSSNVYQIEYSKIPEGETIAYKARLITAQEIAKITGADKLLSWDETLIMSDWYYFDGAKAAEVDSTWQTQVVGSSKEIKTSEYYWLYDRTIDCVLSGCKVTASNTYGYWTSSATDSTIYNNAWRVHHVGYVRPINVTSTINPGIRPVIEILKSSI